MPRNPPTITIRAPELDDAAVVEIHNFLEDLMNRFESRYGMQMRRFYDDRRQSHARHEPKLNDDPDDQPPF